MSYLDNVRTFVRVFELGSMSAAGRDLRVSPAVASSRISLLEEHLGVRLFQRTTRRLAPTEQGHAFYPGACAIIEAEVSSITENPKGSIHVAAPLGMGRRIVAPEVPAFAATYPLIDVRLRLTDRHVDLTAEGLDLRFVVGRPEDSSLRIRSVAECRRVLCAAPAYVAERGHPRSGDDLADGRHDCLNLRFPGATEFQWTLMGEDGPRRFRVSGRFECDDGDVLTDWALAGHGIALKPVFEVADHLAQGRLVPVAEATPPLPIQVTCLYKHRHRQDPKARLFMDFIIERIGHRIRAAEARLLPDQRPQAAQLPR